MALHARSTGEPELIQNYRRRRESPPDGDRSAPTRRARRRRHSTPWLQRNALSVAAISILIAFLGLGFGLLQVLTRTDAAASSASGLTLAQSELAAPPNISSNGTTVMSAAAVGPGVQMPPPPGPVASPAESTRPIQANARVLAANYTIAAGDTLVKIAQRFNTTVERIQAFNAEVDPHALRIGAQLVIPPPL